MGDLQRGDGDGSLPEDGGRDKVPDLPAEWGTVVVPDDPAELADEADALRRELRRTAHRRRIRRALTRRVGRREPSGVGMPLAIVGVALLTTLISLFVVTWDKRPAPPRPTVPAASAKITEYALGDGAGHLVRLAELLPAVVLLVDGCACHALIGATAGAVPGRVRVVPVAQTAPVIADAPANVVALADPAGRLRARFAPGPTTGAATAVLVPEGGTIQAIVPAVRTVNDLGDLTRLAG
ncbi:MAG: hypothetical protein ACM30G_18105 [Micromonosporaceae bacterium]